MSDANKAICKRFFDQLWNEHNPAITDELLTADHRRYDPSYPPELPGGAEGFKLFVQGVLAGIPDIRFATEEQIAERDLVVTRWTVSGTQTGEFMGLPASGNRVLVTGIDIARLRDGKIAEIWANWDSAGLLRQLTAVPA